MDIREKLKAMTFPELVKFRQSLDEDKEYDEWDQAGDELRQRQLAVIPRPTCCQAAKDYPAVRFYAGFDKGKLKGAWQAGRPEGAEELAGKVTRGLTYHTSRPEARFCCYCGLHLPKLVPKKEFPEHTSRVTDGGYSCDTCGGSQDCVCLPPEFAFEPA